jgi:hypothetical protein
VVDLLVYRTQKKNDFCKKLFFGGVKEHLIEFCSITWLWPIDGGGDREIPPEPRAYFD